jgi:hypothetical protein
MMTVEEQNWRLGVGDAQGVLERAAEEIQQLHSLFLSFFFSIFFTLFYQILKNGCRTSWRRGGCARRTSGSR